MKTVRHRIPSECWSTDDDQAAQNFNGWDFVGKALQTAVKCRVEVNEIVNPFVNCLPGDHYRILAGLIFNLDRSIGPLTLVDIGTHYGTSARVMLDFSADEDSVITFDIVPWQEHDILNIYESDFDKKLTQYVEDLQDLKVFAKHRKLLNDADFIMCDGPKDGKFEKNFLTLLSTIEFTKKPRWLFLDDIRFPSELLTWRLINSPKIDLTSFGHFTGTGLVNISEGFKFG